MFFGHVGVAPAAKPATPKASRFLLVQDALKGVLGQELDGIDALLRLDQLRYVILKKELISAKLATSLINWRHSGFSVDASVHIPAGSAQTGESLSQYIAGPFCP